MRNIFDVQFFGGGGGRRVNKFRGKCHLKGAEAEGSPAKRQTLPLFWNTSLS